MHGVSVTMFDTDEDKGKAYVMQTAHIGFFPSAWPDSAQNRPRVPEKGKSEGSTKEQLRPAERGNIKEEENSRILGTVSTTLTRRVVDWPHKSGREPPLPIIVVWTFLFQEFQLQSLILQHQHFPLNYIWGQSLHIQNFQSCTGDYLWDQC